VENVLKMSGMCHNVGYFYTDNLLCGLKCSRRGSNTPVHSIKVYAGVEV
jgi:hypothetical protein